MRLYPLPEFFHSNVLSRPARQVLCLILNLLWVPVALAQAIPSVNAISATGRVSAAKPTMVAPPAPAKPRADCMPQVNFDEPPSWKLIDQCHEPKIHAILQQLLNLQRAKDREQSQRYPRLVASETQNWMLYWQLPPLTKGVRAIMQMANLAAASAAEKQAASALAAGNPEPAIALLGSMATSTWRAELLRQQAALQRTTSLPQAVLLAGQAAELDENQADNLRNLANWSDLEGDLPRALAWHRKIASRFDASRQNQADNEPFLWSLSDHANQVGNLEYELQNLEQALKHYQRAATALHTLLGKTPHNMILKRNVAFAENKIGNVLAALSRNEEALKPYRHALMLRQQVLANSPDSTQLQRDMVVSLINLGAAQISLEQFTDALTFYQRALPLQIKLMASPANNPEWEAELAATHNRIGDLLSTLKLPASDAMTSHVAARTLLLKLVARPTGSSTNWQHALALTHKFIADLQRNEQQYTLAMASYQAALALEKELIVQDASIHRWQRDLANTWSKIAALQNLQEDKAAALASLRIELALRQRLHAKAPEQLLWQLELATNHEQLGDTLMALQQVQAANKPYQDALSVRQRLGGGESVGTLRLQAISWARLATAHYRLEAWDAALKANEAELGLRRKVVALAPQEIAWQRELALMGLYLGDALQMLNRNDDALTQYRDAIAQLEKLVNRAAGPAADSPANSPANSTTNSTTKSTTNPASTHAELGVAHVKLGKLLQKTDRMAQAKIAFQAAVTLAQMEADKQPELSEAKNSLSTHLSHLANLAFQEGQYADALKTYQAALSILIKLNLAEPKQVRWKAYLAVIYQRIGDCHSALGSDIDGLSHYNAGLAWQQQASSEQADREGQLDLAHSQVRIGDLQIRLGYFDAALQSYQSAQAIFEPLLKKDPASSSLQRTVAAVLLRLGDTQGDLKNFPAADRFLQQALQMRQVLAQAEPQDEQLQANVALVHVSLGLVQEAQERHEGAIAQYQLALNIVDKLLAKAPNAMHWQLASAGYAGRIANVDGNQLAPATRMSMLQESITRFKRLQRQQPLPDWAAHQLAQMEKKLDHLKHPERAKAAAAKTALEAAAEAALRELNEGKPAE